MVAAHKLAQVDAGQRVGAPLAAALRVELPDIAAWPDRLAERVLFAVQGPAKAPEQG